MLWRYAVAVLLGATAVQALPTLPPVWWPLLVMLAILPVCRLFPVLKLLLAGLLMLSWSVWLAQNRLDQRLPEELAGQDIQVSGIINSLPESRERGGQRFRFALDKTEIIGQQLPDVILLSTYKPDFQVSAGERWRFTVRLKPPHGFQNPGGFDYEAYLFRHDIGARGYVRKHPEPERLAKAHAFTWLAWRADLKKRIENLLGDHLSSPLVVGLLVGDRSGLEKTHWTLLQNTGTAHLMAISGLHIGMVAGFLYLLVRWIWALWYRAGLLYPAQKAAAVSSLFVAVIYAGLAGFSIPTQRALIMLAMAVVALMLNRPMSFVSLFSATLIAVLLWDPFSVLDTGFWLSFTAVAVIAWAMTGKRNWSRLKQFLHVQLAVSAGLLPLVMARFQMAPWLSPLANLLAVPVFTFAVVPMLLLGAVLMTIPGSELAGQFLVIACADLLAWVWFLLEQMARWPGARWPVTPPPAWAMVTALLGMAWILAPRPVPGRWLGMLWLLPLFYLSADRPATGDFRLTMLDVGQGLAVHIQTKAHDLIFDTGPAFGSTFDTGDAVVLPYLRSLGVTQLDTLIISHGDNDHAGGARSVVAGIPVKQIISAEPGDLSSGRCRTGMSWQWDQVEFRILHPDEGYYRRRNNNACVLRVGGPGGSALLPADIELRAERALLMNVGEALESTILVAPHHGSKTSSGSQFLAAVNPQWVLIPAGYRNRYRHPHPTVVQRYRTLGAVLIDSASAGAISMSVERREITAIGYRQRYRRYWHHRALQDL